MRARSEARSLQERAAESNLENASSYAQTADGWLQSIDDILGRMGELAVMANDGTKSALDRQNLQYEFSQMQKAIQSITTGPDALAKFNGIPLFQGDALASDAAPIPSPDLTASSPVVIGASVSGESITWGGAISQGGIEELSAAVETGAVIQMASNHLGQVRATLGADVMAYPNEGAGAGHLLVQV